MPNLHKHYTLPTDQLFNLEFAWEGPDLIVFVNLIVKLLTTRGVSQKRGRLMGTRSPRCLLLSSSQGIRTSAHTHTDIFFLLFHPIEIQLRERLIVPLKQNFKLS